MFNKHGLLAYDLRLLIIVFISINIVALNGCNNEQKQAEKYLADGKELARVRCSSCHELPDPALLDKHTWETGVLPVMAQQFHLQYFMDDYLAGPGSAISLDDWHKIVNYYKTLAPEKLTIPKPDAVKDWAVFSLKRPPGIDPNGHEAMTTMVTYNINDHHIYTGDAASDLYRWDDNLKPHLVKKFNSPVTAVDFYAATDKPNQATVTCIGILPPNDQLKGELQDIDLNNRKKSGGSSLITDSLPRPVHTVMADFNKDGLIDYVTCGFGRNQGGLILVQQQADHQFKRKMIRAVPGATQVTIGDFNGDGWPDIICLFAQADEGVWLFLNDKKGGFTIHNLLHFPSVYGSSSFQLADFNHDGKPDILYTCGDNNDYSQVFKPYHGVYIFTNQGNWKFKQTYFYHINGCTKAMAADFDHDGDLDIASIAFFPDFKFHPAEGFTYFEQTAPGKFRAHEVPVNPYGHWLTMDVNDVDQDGYPDVILGNFSIGARGFITQKGYTPDWDMHEPFVVLHNTAGQKK